MECKECGTSVDREAHENFICFDCYCRLDLEYQESADAAAEEVRLFLAKKNSDEEE